MNTVLSTTEYFYEILVEYYNNHYFVGYVLIISLGYAYYYYTHIAKVPQLAGNDRYTKFLLRHCPMLAEPFRPTFWCTGPRAQTIARAFFKSSPDVPRVKEFLDLKDGGHVALDWSVNEDSVDNTPVVIILPGLLGDGDQSYALHLFKKAYDSKYRTLIFNYRGCGGADLKVLYSIITSPYELYDSTARMYNGCNTSDLEEVIEHVHDRYPKAKVMAVGVSLGGIILTNYLAKHRENVSLVAAMTASAPWNPHVTVESMNTVINRHLFNRPLCNEYKEQLRNLNRPLQELLFDNDLHLSHTLESTNIHDLDVRFIAPHFGFESIEEYYENLRIDTKVKDIRTPLLAINAADDPFSPEHAFPIDDARKSDFVTIAITRHGGHIGFMEGAFPRHAGYSDRLFEEFARAVFTHSDELRRVTTSPSKLCDETGSEHFFANGEKTQLDEIFNLDEKNITDYTICEKSKFSLDFCPLNDGDNNDSGIIDSDNVGEFY